MSLSTRIQALAEHIASIVKSKQNTLVSGTNIKTINGISILGSGDIVVSGSGGITEQQARNIARRYAIKF